MPAAAVETTKASRVDMERRATFTAGARLFAMSCVIEAPIPSIDLSGLRLKALGGEGDGERGTTGRRQIRRVGLKFLRGRWSISAFLQSMAPILRAASAMQIAGKYLLFV